MKIQINDTLKLARISSELVETIEPFTILIDNIPFTVPAQFISNGNSTPQMLWSVIPPLSGPYGEAGIVHDYIYSTQCKEDITRKEGDEIHFEIGRYRGANLIKAKCIYRILRMFGRSYWKKV